MKEFIPSIMGVVPLETIHYIQTSFQGPYHDGLVDLRYRVFVEEQNVPEEIEIDEFDEAAVHLVAVLGKRVVGTCRIVSLGDAMRIGRLSVDEAHRHQGIATHLMDLALAYSKDSGTPRVILDAQVNAIGFYERFGFYAVGEPFDDGGIDHKRMILDLVAGPPLPPAEEKDR